MAAPSVPGMDKIAIAANIDIAPATASDMDAVPDNVLQESAKRNVSSGGTVTKLVRKLSFSKRASAPARAPAESDSEPASGNERMRRTSLGAIGGVRSLSFKRSRKSTSDPIKELDVYKKDKDDRLGLSLMMSDKETGAVVVACVAEGALAAKKGIVAGDILLAVNGMKPSDHKEGSALLRESVGVVQLIIEKRPGLPSGWVKTQRDGKAFFLHPDTLSGSYLHPTCLPTPQLNEEATIYVSRDEPCESMPKLNLRASNLAAGAQNPDRQKAGEEPSDGAQAGMRAIQDHIQAMAGKSRMIESVQAEALGMTPRGSMAAADEDSESESMMPTRLRTTSL